MGEERYAGGWQDRLHRLLRIAVVSPTARDEQVIRHAAQGNGWRVKIDAVKYGRAQLISFYQGIRPPENGSCSAIGWDPQLNRVVMHMTRFDEETESFFRPVIPEDALLLRYVGPERFVAA